MPWAMAPADHAGIEWEPAGRYWGGREPTDGEWDVVSVSADRRHVFSGECKWMQSVTPAKVAAAIRVMKQREKSPLPPGVAVHYGLLLPDGGKLPTELDGVALLDAARLVATEGRPWESVKGDKQRYDLF